MDRKTIGSQDIFLIRGASRPVPPLSSIGGFAPPNPPNVNTPQNPQNFQITVKYCLRLNVLRSIERRSFCCDLFVTIICRVTKRHSVLYSYSRAKKSVPLLIFVKIGTKVDLIIPIFNDHICLNF